MLVKSLEMFTQLRGQNQLIDAFLLINVMHSESHIFMHMNDYCVGV